MAIGNYQSGSFSNVTLCPIIATLPLGAVSGIPFSTGVILFVRYHITVGAGTTAGSAAFQELGSDGGWRTMGDVAALSFTAAGEYSGVVNGPFHGVRISLGALTGGTVSFAELIGATLT